MEITELFLKLLKHYLSFFDYEFVGMIIERHCPELIDDLEAYKSALKIYCKRRVVEVPSNVFEREGADETCLFVKCDKAFESIILDDIKALESRLSNFLDTDLFLLRVDDGCTELVFDAMCPIPPLTQSQRCQLTEMGILKLHSVHFQNTEGLPSSSNKLAMVTASVSVSTQTSDPSDEKTQQLIQAKLLAERKLQSMKKQMEEEYEAVR